jgi:hypothetical protein
VALKAAAVLPECIRVAPSERPIVFTLVSTNQKMFFHTWEKHANHHLFFIVDSRRIVAFWTCMT